LSILFICADISTGPWEWLRHGISRHDITTHGAIPDHPTLFIAMFFVTQREVAILSLSDKGAIAAL